MKKQLPGIKLQSKLRAGYMKTITEGNETLTVEQSCANTCLQERNDRTLYCFGKGWPQNDPASPYCAGNENGKELDRCMSTCLTPEEMAKQRAAWGKPYYSVNGDTCFNQFVDRAKGTPVYSAESAPWPSAENRAEWEKCLTASGV